MEYEKNLLLNNFDVVFAKSFTAIMILGIISLLGINCT